MRRVLCVWLPTFSTDLVKRRFARQQRREGGPGLSRRHAVLLTRPVASRELVARCCETAADQGVSPGMDVAHARSVLRSGLPAHVELHRPDRDAAALHGVASWALRFSPLVACDSPDGLVIDITGTQRLYRTEGRIVRMVAGQLRRLGFNARIAVAATIGCAWAVSRFAAPQCSRVLPGREREAIADLPVAALRIDPDTGRHLGEVGITRVQHLLDLPRASLASRFDPQLNERLRQALGEAMGECRETVEPVRPITPAQAEMVFDGPTDHYESIQTAARRVLEQLAAQLERQERGVRRLAVELRRPHASTIELEVTLSRPSRSARHLWNLLHARLDRVDLSEGIDAVIMTAARTARLRHEQQNSGVLGGGVEETHEAAWGECIDTLASKLGPNAVVFMEPVESHLPERAFRERSAMDALRRPVAAAVTSADRPTTLFARPEPADAMTIVPDGPILSFGWRGQRWNVVTCIGPERIGREWWRWGVPEVAGPEGDGEEEPRGATHSAPRSSRRSSSGGSRRGSGQAPPPDRDYFMVQTDNGRWIWLCRHAFTSRWFVHGVWN